MNPLASLQATAPASQVVAGDYSRMSGQSETIAL